jgi:hypothetical protein
MFRIDEVRWTCVKNVVVIKKLCSKDMKEEENGLLM